MSLKIVTRLMEELQNSNTMVIVDRFAEAEAYVAKEEEELIDSHSTSMQRVERLHKDMIINQKQTDLAIEQRQEFKLHLIVIIYISIFFKQIFATYPSRHCIYL